MQNLMHAAERPQSAPMCAGAEAQTSRELDGRGLAGLPRDAGEKRMVPEQNSIVLKFLEGGMG